MDISTSNPPTRNLLPFLVGLANESRHQLPMPLSYQHGHRIGHLATTGVSLLIITSITSKHSNYYSAMLGDVH